jgi:hypothetical protein
VDERDAGLSEQATTILGLIAEGRSYDQILQQQPTLTYFDVFAAAREALDLLQVPKVSAPPTEVDDIEVLSATSLPSFIERARESHGRAWARWTPDEDARLISLFKQGESRAEIERQLGRQPGAVERRLLKLRLIADGASVGPSGGPEVAHEVHPWIPGSVNARDQAGRMPSQPTVPGWEALRDRLTPNREIP